MNLTLEQNAQKHLLRLLAAIWLSCAGAEGATVVYQNTFDTPLSLNGFTIYGERFFSYNPPPLHEVSVASGELRITTDFLRPNGPGNPPVLLGRATLMRDTSALGNGYHTTISKSAGLVSWSFNLANQDGAFNNSFHFVLLSTREDPFDAAADGYYFQGGGMVGNRMGLWRFDLGLGGGQSPLIDLTNGLGTLPARGSFRITYDPTTDVWSLFGETGALFVDPESVSNLLGSAVDGTYTTVDTPFMGMGGGNTGVNTFDNVTVSVVPEPSSYALLAAAISLLAIGVRVRLLARFGCLKHSGAVGKSPEKRDQRRPSPNPLLPPAVSASLRLSTLN